ncbi:heme-copper oxidase subunit III [bacterium]|nr:heme-copper oxidase subunit III [bacterium]
MAVHIPYIDKPNPVTGVTNAKLGVWLFLASEVMLFGALFSALITLRMGVSDWPHGYDVLNVPLATLNTVVLIFSSVTVVMSWAALKMNNLKQFKTYMGLTLLMSFIFLGVKAVEYGTKFSHGISPATSNFYAIYFVITGLHGLHILGGIIVNGYLLGPGSKMWQSEPERFTGRIECAGLYWHFVDLVWIFLFPILYLL